MHTYNDEKEYLKVMTIKHFKDMILEDSKVYDSNHESSE
jgi:hypothetical protein